MIHIRTFSFLKLITGLTSCFSGYTMSEARVGLRACGGDIDRTVSHIIELRSSREEARKRTRKERRLMKVVGESKDKTWVNPRSLTDLVDMGFPSELCVAALQLSDNNVADAVGLSCDFSKIFFFVTFLCTSLS